MPNLPNGSNLLSLYIDNEPHLATHQILEKLSDYSSLSITDSLEEKDNFKQQLFDLIYCGYFDELEGGLIIDKKHLALSSSNTLFTFNLDTLCYKPLAINISLCRILIAADQVYYSGEFSELAINIGKYLLTQLLKRGEYSLLDVEFYCYFKDFNCCIDQSELASVLDSKEYQLFSTLSNLNTNSTRVAYLKNSSLKNCCELIGMQYKEGQIIQHTISEKISSRFSLNNSKPHKLSNQLKNLFLTNCELVETLVELYLSTNNIIFKKKAIQVFLDLENLFYDSEIQFSEHDTIAFIGSAINLLTIKFCEKLVANLRALIFKISPVLLTLISENKLDDLTNQKVWLIINFVQHLPENNSYPCPLIDIEIPEKFQYQMIMIDDSSLHETTQIEHINYRFNTMKKVFFIH